MNQTDACRNSFIGPKSVDLMDRQPLKFINEQPCRISMLESDRNRSMRENCTFPLFLLLLPSFFSSFRKLEAVKRKESERMVARWL